MIYKYDFQTEVWSSRTEGSDRWSVLRGPRPLPDSADDDIRMMRDRLCSEFGKLYEWVEHNGEIVSMEYSAMTDPDGYVLPSGQIELMFWPAKNSGMDRRCRTVRIQTTLFIACGGKDCYCPTRLSYDVRTHWSLLRKPSKHSWRVLKLDMEELYAEE